MRYLGSLALTKTVPCLAEPGKSIVIGKPNRLLDEVIPYLATLPGVITYNPKTLTLTFRRPRGFMTLHPEKVTITQVDGAEEGLILFQALVDAINATWERREELAAVTAARWAPGWLDIWSLLPRTNCKKCGEATCQAFAVLLIQQKHTLEDCPPLSQDPAFMDRRVTLEAMLV